MPSPVRRKAAWRPRPRSTSRTARLPHRPRSPGDRHYATPVRRNGGWCSPDGEWPGNGPAGQYADGRGAGCQRSRARAAGRHGERSPGWQRTLAGHAECAGRARHARAHHRLFHLANGREPCVAEAAVLDIIYGQPASSSQSAESGHSQSYARLDHRRGLGGCGRQRSGLSRQQPGSAGFGCQWRPAGRTAGHGRCLAGWSAVACGP